MNINKATRRDRKISRKDRMIVDGRSVFDIERIKKKRDETLKRQREDKEKRKEQ